MPTKTGNAHQDSDATLANRIRLGNAHQDSGETPRRLAALGNAHQDKVRIHPYFAIHNTISSLIVLQRRYLWHLLPIKGALP
ncbi:MAG: hypothetical protein AAF703_15340 [Cyanobacteria bacterium P01_D01_bin.105]